MRSECTPQALAAVGLAVGLCLCSCASSNKAIPQTPLLSADEAAYSLGPGDKLRVITFGETDLTGEFVVNESGRVSLPLIGSIQASGLTLNQFSSSVEKALANGYIRQPHVSVEVLNYRPFYILGEVSKPGEYPFISGLTVTNAVATAGGFTYRANVHRLFLRGQRDTREHPVPLTGTTLVHPGDTIRIPERLF